MQIICNWLDEEYTELQMFSIHYLQEQECFNLGLKVNPDQSKATIGCAEIRTRISKIQDSPLEQASSYQCLGIWVDKKLSSKLELEYLRGIAASTQAVVMSLAGLVTGPNVQALRTFHIAPVILHVDYNASVM